MPMLTVCSNCGLLHPLDDGSCRQRRAASNTDADRFRRTRRWSNMSKQIRERDRYLCQVCIIEAYDTYDQFNYTSLEVNHIYPAENYEALRLEPTNLLTMCTTHHKLADRGGIPTQLMLDLAAYDRDYEIIKKRVREGGYPPTPIGDP